MTGRALDGSSPRSAWAERQPGGNPAFDVTPARLVSGLITERGLCAATEPALREMFRDPA